MKTNEDLYRVNVGRLNPLHLGHESLINTCTGGFKGEFLQVLGSSNAPLSLRQFFNYEERRGFFKQIYPQANLVGLPDYTTDKEWMLGLDDLLMSAFGLDSTEEVKNKCTFIGGCEEDVDFFLEDGRSILTVNRFDGTTPKISATEVRDSLIQGRDLRGLLNDRLIEDVRGVFDEKWEKFKKI